MGWNMVHFFQSALLSICSVLGMSACSSVDSSYELQNVSEPIAGQFVGKNYSKRSDFKPGPWNIELNEKLLRIERTTSDDAREKIVQNLRNAVLSIETAYPDLTLPALLQIAGAARQLASSQKEKEAQKIMEQFKKRYSDDVLDKFFEVHSKLVWAILSVEPATNVDDLIVKQIALLSLSGRDSQKEYTGLKLDISNQRMMSYQARNLLAESSEELAQIEDLSSYGTVKPVELAQMYTGINNFFLKNYTAAATTFITADEYTNKGSDYYLYNKLHLYAVIARLNWPEARAFLKRVEESVTDEKMRESWAFSIIHAINTMDFTTLMSKVDTLDDTENKSVRAENLCEAYYYVGMDLYNRGQNELAKIFFVMSKAQHVPYFMEYTMSDLALKRYYSGDSDRTGEPAAAGQEAGETAEEQEGTVPSEGSDGQPSGEKTDLKNSNEEQNNKK